MTQQDHTTSLNPITLQDKELKKLEERIFDWAPDQCVSQSTKSLPVWKKKQDCVSEEGILQQNE